MDLVLKQAKPQYNKFETGSLIVIHSPLCSSLPVGALRARTDPAGLGGLAENDMNWKRVP